MSKQPDKKPFKKADKQKQENSTKPNKESSKTSASPQEPNQSQKPSKHSKQSEEQSSEEPCGSSQSSNPQDKSPVREEDDIYYVHGLSPIKQGGNGKSYFNCVLQGQESARRAVCFSPRKHKMLSQVVDSKSPVKISRLSFNINNTDVILGDRSAVSLVQKASFDPDKRFYSDSVLTLHDLYGLAPGQMVKCHVSSILEETIYKTRSNENIPRQEVILCDSETSVKLVLYNDDVNTLSLGKSYIIKNVRLHSYKDTMYLNTTTERAFEYEEIDTMSDVRNTNVATEVKILCKIVGVTGIYLNHNCINCSKKITSELNKDDSSLICNHCQAIMKLSNCHATVSLSLVLNDISKNTTVTLYFPPDRSQKLQSIVNFSLESDALIAKALLEFPDIFEVTFDFVSKIVLKVLKV